MSQNPRTGDNQPRKTASSFVSTTVYTIQFRTQVQESHLHPIVEMNPASIRSHLETCRDFSIVPESSLIISLFVRAASAHITNAPYKCTGAWAAAPGKGRFPAIFTTFNIMPIIVAWKESTSNRPGPPAVAPWSRPGLEIDVTSIVLQKNKEVIRYKRARLQATASPL